MENTFLMASNKYHTLPSFPPSPTPSLPPSPLTDSKQVPVVLHVAQDGVPRLQHRLVGVLRAVPQLGDGLVVQAYAVEKKEGGREGGNV